MEGETKEVRIYIDCTSLKEKINQLIDHAGLASLQGVLDNLSCGKPSLLDDIFFCELTSTVTAGGITEIVQRVDFGAGVENTFATVRA